MTTQQWTSKQEKSMIEKNEIHKRLKKLRKDTANLAQDTLKLQRQLEQDKLNIQAIKDRMPPKLYKKLEPLLHDSGLIAKIGSLNLVKIVVDLYFENQFQEYLD
jgi:hypothetical protein